MDGKTCKRGSEVAPIVLTRFSVYKNQARVAEEKEKEAIDRETTAIERENKVKRREEKARVRERIAREKLQKYKFALVVSWEFFAIFCVFSGRMGEFGTKTLCLPWKQVVVVIV